MTFYPSLLIQVWGITALVPRGDAFGCIFEWTMDHGQKNFSEAEYSFFWLFGRNCNASIIRSKRGINVLACEQSFLDVALALWHLAEIYAMQPNN